VKPLVRAAAGPVICALALTGLLCGWVVSGGGGTFTKVRLQITLAALPMRGFTPGSQVGSAKGFLTIRDVTGTADQLVAASSPIARQVTVPGQLVVPAHGTLTLSPFGADLVFEDPARYEALTSVPLTLTFKDAGNVTIDVPVTEPGTP
jgi:copper(I)-binding protein